MCLADWTMRDDVRAEGPTLAETETKVAKPPELPAEAEDSVSLLAARGHEHVGFDVAQA